MNLPVVVRRLLFFSLLHFPKVFLLVVPASEDKYEILNNAVVGEAQTMNNKDTVEEVVLTDDQILQLYPDLNMTAKPKTPPTSIMSGKISDHLIKKMADYLFGLLQGTGEVIKPTTTTTTSSSTTSTTVSPISSTSSPEFLPFRPTNQKFFDDLAVIKDVPQVSTNLGELRRKPRMRGVSRKKSEKLWRKTRMVLMSGRI